MTSTAVLARGAAAYAEPQYLPTAVFGSAGPVTAAAPAGRRWPPLIDRLLAIRNYSDDWDGLGAVAPDPAVVDTAIVFARRRQVEGFPPADRVTAGVDGTVCFEWHRPTFYLEVEVTAPGRIETWLIRPGADRAVEIDPWARG